MKTIEQIKKCQRCGLCKNQCPLLDKQDACEIIWVGLSAKMITIEKEIPLSPTTNSGKIIEQAEKIIGKVETYKTNLVKCVPLNDENKLRYPSKREIDVCFDNLMIEINLLKPKIVFLLGEKVYKAVGKQLQLSFEKWEEFNFTFNKKNGVYYIPIQHPSYIYVYKRKFISEYIEGINRITMQLL